MPNCRKCGARISKFDKDFCPVCGEPNPLEGVSSETVDITSAIDLENIKLQSAKPKTKFLCTVLFIFLGIFAAPYFYLYKIKLAIIYLISNIIWILGFFFIFAFGANLGVGAGLGIAFGSAYLLNIINGVSYLFRHDIKDGHGEFVR